MKGNTALHDCAESGSLEIMKLLLTSGARIDVDAYGKFVWNLQSWNPIKQGLLCPKVAKIKVKY